MARGVTAKSTSRIGPGHFTHTVTSIANTCFTKTAHGCLLGGSGRHREPRRTGCARATRSVKCSAASFIRAHNIHLHVLALDGVFTEQSDGELVFHPSPPPTTPEVTELLKLP
jgi:hypothetical protein